MSGNTVVMKGTILGRADTNLIAPNAEQSENLKDNPLWEAGVEQNVLDTPDEPHVKKHWFGADWWPNIAGKEQILSSAYVKAIELSTKNPGPDGAPLPIQSLWISGVREKKEDGSEVDVFEVGVMLSRKQVTVVLVTPPHPKTKFPPASEIFKDSVWLVASATRIADVRASYLAHYNEAQVPSEEEPIPNNGAKALQLIGY